METKRYIGNDMARIFARVRRELGPDAVIVQTRSLLRDGADPLIEVLATAGDGTEDTLTLALQRVLVEGSLDRAQAPQAPAARGLTIGDLEDIAARERQDAAAARDFEQAYQRREPEPQPEWLEGFVSTTSHEELPAHLADLFAMDEPGYDEPLEAIPPFDLPEAAPPPPIQWSPRPRIVSRPNEPQSQPRQTEAPAAFDRAPRFQPIEPGIASALVAAGFSPAAARIIAEASGTTNDPRQALETTLAEAAIQYPVENRTAIITIQGPPGSGRTTALMRMALDCADSGREAVLVAADSSHAGGRAQVHAYGEAIGLPVFDAFSPKDLVQAITRAPRGACVFVDVPAGRWAPPPVPGVAHFVYLAVPAHWQPSALEQELAEFDTAACAGAVLTGTDLATSLTPAIALVVEAALGIAFLSSGRDVGTGIEVADPFTLASGVFTTSSRETTNGRLAVTA